MTTRDQLNIIIVLLVVIAFTLIFDGCGESVPSASLPPPTIGVPVGHSISSREYAAWCGVECRCKVFETRDCASTDTWLAEGTPPQPNAPFQPPNSVTPVECNP